MTSLEYHLRSPYEERIASWLERNRIPFRYESSLFVFDYGRPRIWQPDFHLPEASIYIECYGANDADYRRTTRKKQAVYRANGIPVIPVHRRHFERDLARYLSWQLRSYANVRAKNIDSMHSKLDRAAQHEDSEQKLKALGVRYRLDRPVYLESKDGPRVATANFYLPDHGHYVKSYSTLGKSSREQELFRQNGISVTPIIPVARRDGWERDLVGQLYRDARMQMRRAYESIDSRSNSAYRRSAGEPCRFPRYR